MAFENSYFLKERWCEYLRFAIKQLDWLFIGKLGICDPGKIGLG